MTISTLFGPSALLASTYLCPPVFVQAQFFPVSFQVPFLSSPQYLAMLYPIFYYETCYEKNKGPKKELKRFYKKLQRWTLRMPLCPGKQANLTFAFSKCNLL